MPMLGLLGYVGSIESLDGQVGEISIPELKAGNLANHEFQ